MKDNKLSATPQQYSDLLGNPALPVVLETLREDIRQMFGAIEAEKLVELQLEYQLIDKLETKVRNLAYNASEGRTYVA